MRMCMYMNTFEETNVSHTSQEHHYRENSFGFPLLGCFEEFVGKISAL